MSTLKEQVAARIKQADEEKIGFKARLIMRCLGDWQEDVPEPSGEKTSGEYQDTCFVMSYMLYISDDGGAGSNCEIKYNGEIVYKEGGLQVSIFKPNKRGWQKAFENLYARAQVEDQAQKDERAAERAQKVAAEEATQRNNFGL